MAGSSEVGVGVQAQGMLLRRALASALEESEWRQDVLRERESLVLNWQGAGRPPVESWLEESVKILK